MSDSSDYRLIGREGKEKLAGTLEARPVRVGDVEFGGPVPAVIAGPCAVESREQTLAIARAVKEAGADCLRGGAYKPRTSPYSFQGLGREGLEILAEAREETGLLIVTEVMSPDQVPLVSKYADVLQLGTRNRQGLDVTFNAPREINVDGLFNERLDSRYQRFRTNVLGDWGDATGLFVTSLPTSKR